MEGSNITLIPGEVHGRMEESEAVVTSDLSDLEGVSLEDLRRYPHGYREQLKKRLLEDLRRPARNVSGTQNPPRGTA